MAEALREAGAGERAFAFDERDFQRVCRMIHARAGISLGPHKRDMVYSRLARRLRARGIERFDDYLDLVDRDQDGEDQHFVNALTTNLTSFFREAHHFPLLADQLRAMHRPGAPLLVWCCAASTGEEPWSLAITACEAFDSLAPPVRIVATDIDTTVLQTAARGVYPLERIEGIDLARRRRFFQRGSGANEGLCRVRPELRALVEFRPLNLLERDYGLKPGACAAVFCRNVMIYFDKPTQYQVLQKIAPLLGEDGRLYTGHSESFNHAGDLVAPCGHTVYRAVAAGARA